MFCRVCGVALVGSVSGDVGNVHLEERVAQPHLTSGMCTYTAYMTQKMEPPALRSVSALGVEHELCPP